MSRQTTSQIIAKGDYLSANFDAKTLTIPHLIGIFAYHQVQYPSQHNKAKLVDIFNTEIKTNGSKLRRQRLERQETLASEDGIVDGVTGAPIAPTQPLPVRRSSRRLSREPSQEPTRPDPPKRRRSSAEPSIGRPTRKSAIKPAPVISEESEDELQEQPEPEPLPLPKVGKRKDSEAAGPSSRRVSQKFGPGTDDSGWEDNNIFQSGAESSSPIRPSKPKAPRKSNLRKSRASMSAPPESPTRSPSSPVFSPPHAKFNPNLPSIVTQSKSRLAAIKNEIEDSYIDDNSGLADVSAEIVLEEEDSEEEHDDVDQEQEFDEDESILEDAQTAEVAQRISDGGAVIRKPLTHVSSRSTPLWQRVLVALFVLVLSGLAGQYKLESAPIGYCDTGSHTNDVLMDIREKRQEIEGCHAQFTEGGNIDKCVPLPLIPLPRPDACTPCPAHAICSRYSARCEDGYIMHPHLLANIPYSSNLADGLPGLGPIAFPPKCVDDELRKKNINVLGKKMDAALAEIRGERICAGIDTQVPVDGGEARRWGYRIDELLDLMKKQYPRESNIPKFEELYWEALPQLRKYGRLIEDKDSENNQYLASDHADLSWSCRGIVAARQSWTAWRKSVFGMVGIFLFGLYGKSQMTARSMENRRVAELVQIALDTLRNQEMNYHTDPVTTPQPYLSSLQLRDLILQDEHSIPVRRRLWDRVERIVEGNANVRANLEELRGGEEARVWSWVGSSGLLSPVKNRVLPFQSPSHEELGAGSSGEVQRRVVA
ncbi:Man1-Src1p-C-terminal domain-containing protein [Phellopilus nigrolimitatus]|nr:Man1-Src1p-C-terminal domain-containing protein [Phellopilus nigrolimitatus]